MKGGLEAAVSRSPRVFSVVLKIKEDLLLPVEKRHKKRFTRLSAQRVESREIYGWLCGKMRVRNYYPRRPHRQIAARRVLSATHKLVRITNM